MAPCDPVSTTPVLAATLVVVTGKVASSIPAGTVIVAGTFATAGLMLVKFTLMPPAGAAVPRVTVPETFLDPTIAVGLTARMSFGFTVSTTCFVTPLQAAVIVAVACAHLLGCALTHQFCYR